MNSPTASDSCGAAPFRLPKFAWLALFAGLAAVVGSVNLYLVGRSLGLIIAGAPAVDWEQCVDAARRVFAGDLYAVTDQYSFPYSPLLAYVFVPLSWLGTLGWRALHLFAAFAMPTWPMRLVTLLSWPFWFDVETGNVLVFVVLAAAWAVRGSRMGIGAFLVLTLLVPRPLMLPVAIWLLWKHPAWRVPFLGLVAVTAIAVAGTGWGDEWLGFILSLTTQFSSPNNLGPTRVIGAAWLLVALPLAAFLTWRGRLGLASLAASYPYLLPYYLLMCVLDLPQRFPRLKSGAWYRETPS
jgi:hypothetical protein